jgi:uncharacterized protein YbjT (DUF2867 family)
MINILVLGATGYIGGKLVPRLLEQGHKVRCLVRDPKKISGKKWDGVEVIQGDVLRKETLSLAFKNVDLIFYLIHSMTTGGKDFDIQDRVAAMNVRAAAGETGVSRIVYLGGLGKKDEEQSPHLRSRHEVGDILRSGKALVTEFRAGVIVGSGSASFEMVHHLVNRLPLMICPRWLIIKTQPISITDVLTYLVESVKQPESVGKIIDIGGPEVLTYRQMMLTVAHELGLRRFLIQVPILTPRLSSYWVNLVTPIPAHLARILIESVRHETICENTDALKIFNFTPMKFEDAVREAISSIRSCGVGKIQENISVGTNYMGIDPSHLFKDRRVSNVEVSCERIFDVVSSIGGNNGWYYANWLWKLRGIIDQQLGGVGLRRGRRHPRELAIGDTLDFWRVEDYLPNRRILLRAEMKVWGRAWLEFQTESINSTNTKFTQTATYYPKGLMGIIYWFSIYPIHMMIFRGMSRAIARKAKDIISK